MEQLLAQQKAKSAINPLYCCWHGSNVYVKVSKEEQYYVLRFEECDRTNRGWTYLHLLTYNEGLIGTDKIFKLEVKDAEKEDATPFLIIAKKYTRGTFDPKPTDSDERR